MKVHEKRHFDIQYNVWRQDEVCLFTLYIFTKCFNKHVCFIFCLLLTLLPIGLLKKSKVVPVNHLKKQKQKAVTMLKKKKSVSCLGSRRILRFFWLTVISIWLFVASGRGGCNSLGPLSSCMLSARCCC